VSTGLSLSSGSNLLIEKLPLPFPLPEQNRQYLLRQSCGCVTLMARRPLTWPLCISILAARCLTLCVNVGRTLAMPPHGLTILATRLLCVALTVAQAFTFALHPSDTVSRMRRQ